MNCQNYPHMFLLQSRDSFSQSPCLLASWHFTVAKPYCGLAELPKAVILWLSMLRNRLDYNQLWHLQDSRGQNLLLPQVKELFGHGASRHFLTVERKVPTLSQAMKQLELCHTCLWPWLSLKAGTVNKDSVAIIRCRDPLLRAELDGMNMKLAKLFLLTLKIPLFWIYSAFIPLNAIMAKNKRGNREKHFSALPW